MKVEGKQVHSNCSFLVSFFIDRQQPRLQKMTVVEKQLHLYCSFLAKCLSTNNNNPEEKGQTGHSYSSILASRFTDNPEEKSRRKDTSSLLFLPCSLSLLLHKPTNTVTKENGIRERNEPQDSVVVRGANSHKPRRKTREKKKKSEREKNQPDARVMRGRTAAALGWL